MTIESAKPPELSSAQAFTNQIASIYEQITFTEKLEFGTNTHLTDVFLKRKKNSPVADQIVLRTNNLLDKITQLTDFCKDWIRSQIAVDFTFASDQDSAFDLQTILENIWRRIDAKKITDNDFFSEFELSCYRRNLINEAEHAIGLAQEEKLTDDYLKKTRSNQKGRDTQSELLREFARDSFIQNSEFSTIPIRTQLWKEAYIERYGIDPD